MRDIEIIEYELRNASPETRKAVMAVKAELEKHERLRELFAEAMRVQNTDDDLCCELATMLRCEHCPFVENTCPNDMSCAGMLLRYIQTGKTY